MNRWPCWPCWRRFLAAWRWARLRWGAHRAQRPPAALVRGVRNSHRDMGLCPGAGHGAGRPGLAAGHRPYPAGLATGFGGLSGYVLAAAAGHRRHGRHLARHGTAAAALAGDRRADWHPVRRQHSGRRLGCGGGRVLLGADLGFGKNGHRLRLPQPAGRRMGLVGFCPGRCCSRAAAGSPRAGRKGRARIGHPVLHRMAQHRLRSAGRAGAQSGHGQHGVHLRLAVGRLPAGHGAGRCGIPALACATWRPRGAAPRLDRHHRAGLPCGRRRTLRRRAAAQCGAAGVGRNLGCRHRRRAGRRDCIGAGRICVADAGHGRTVQPPLHGGPRRR
jgi:hypothetical protein